MISNLDETYSKYEILFQNLIEVISVSEKRVIDNDDVLFIQNVNFFVKSYLVNICSYLEALLQDVAFILFQKISLNLKSANIPINFLHWNLGTNYKDKDLSFDFANFPPKRKDINDKLSANPYKTIKLFELLGVNLSLCSGFSNNKDIVNSIVAKRNSIIHHNDQAVDVSFSDLKEYTIVFLEYSKAIVDHVK